MRELTVAQKQIRDETGTVRDYDYAILVEEIMISSGLACESYGIRIREHGGESMEMPDITVSVTRINDLMERLMRNAVTPCTLRDVVEDWL